MMIRNDHEEERWVNGTLGFVQQFSPGIVFEVTIDGETHTVTPEYRRISSTNTMNMKKTIKRASAYFHAHPSAWHGRSPLTKPRIKR